MAAKKVVLKVQIHEEKDKKKALKKISSLSGIESIAMDMKEKKLTITGEVDAVEIVDKLRKHWNTEVLTIGPAKEPEKNKEDKKDEGKDKDKEIDEIAELLKKYYSYYNYNPYYTHYYHH